MDELVGFDVTVMIQEHVLEDSAAERRESFSNRGESPTAIAAAKPINCEVPNDRDEPGGEPGSMLRLFDPRPEPSQVVRAQRLARAREYIHHIVVVLGIVPDGCEDETPVPIQEQVPRGVGPALL